MLLSGFFHQLYGFQASRSGRSTSSAPASAPTTPTPPSSRCLSRPRAPAALCRSTATARRRAISRSSPTWSRASCALRRRPGTAEQAPGKAFNIANAERTTVLELAAQIVRLTGSKSVCEHLAPRAGDIRDLRLQARSSRANCRATPSSVSFAQGLERLLRETT